MSKFFLLGLLIFSAQAEVFPERGNTEVFYLKDPAIDFAIRLELIAQAKKSIDLISFSQAMDKTGEIFIAALRHAQEKKCIKIRYIYDSVASLLDRDFLNTSGKILSDPNLKCAADKKGEVITVGLWEKWRAGLQWDDFIHQKIILIDAGTSDEKMVVGGRGYTQFSTMVADSGFLFRAVDSSQPYLGTDLVTSFQQIWDQAKIISPPLQHSSQIEMGINVESELDYYLKTNEQNKQFKVLKNIIFSPIKKMIESPEQFRPTSAQLTANDLLKKVLQNKNNDRETFSNDNLELLINTIKNSQGELDLTSYSIAFPETLSQSLVDFLARGNTLNLYTNGQAAHAVFVYQGTPVYYTLDYLEKLIKATKDLKGKLNIYFLNPEKAKLNRDLPFVHRKLIVVGSTIFTGTDNFTWSSAIKNDEWMIKLTDQKFADYLRQDYQDQHRFYDLVSHAEILEQNKQATVLYQIFKFFIKDNY